MKIITTFEAKGRKLSSISLAGEKEKIKNVSLNNSDYFNHKIFTSKWGNILFLEDYGDYVLSSIFRKKLLGTDKYTIGINLKTGCVFIAALYLLKNGHISIYLEDFPHDGIRKFIIPSSFLKKFSKLKINHKRPFNISIPPERLFLFYEREIGWQELKKSLVISFRFQNDSNLEISDYGIRKVSSWKERK